MPPDQSGRTACLQRQKNHLEAILLRLDQLDKRFTLARLICFLAGIIAAVSLFIVQASAWALEALAAFILIFAAIVLLHRRVDRSRLRFRLALSLASTQLARQNLDWEAIPAPISIPVDPGHPFAADLNIIGSRSLHQLLDTATSRGGSLRLAGWLLDLLPDPEAIERRHTLLQELLPLSGYRSRLALRGMLIREDTQGQWDGEKVMRWLERSVAPDSFLPTLALLSALAILNILLLVLNLSGVVPPYWIAGLLLYGFIYLSRYSLYRSMFEDTGILGKSLDQLRSILVFLESASYTSTPRLAQVCEPLTKSARRPSQYLRKFVWLTLAASLGNNPFIAALINAILPWNLFFAYILNRYKKDLHASMQGWLNAWYEMEALCSLANFSWLNPQYALPRLEVNETSPDHPVFSAKNLGHPLIQHTRRVTNDFSLQKPGSVGIITGSNMSGKSTFLRTVGINLCLVNAGGPVAAASLETFPFRLFTCIQVSDSLADGISYFYAEVRRLKQLLKALETPSPYPVFFLIDEIYRGTNNRERRIGSQAYIHALSNSQGVGLVSTHDLDLVQLSNLENNVLNYHFQEDIQDDRMVYDYRLRSGPSPTTNALRIMQIEGLPVDTPRK